MHCTKHLLAGILFLAFTSGFSQELTQEFIDAGYTLTDLGSVNLLPSRYGGLTIRSDQPNTLYICGSANDSPGAVYTVGLVRDPTSHRITGFSGDAVLYMAAPNNDGGIFFAPNGTLLFTRYSMNELGQILPNSTYISTPLTELGIASSVGSIALVPFGYPGAGNIIIASYNAAIVYNVPFTIDGTGLYVFTAPTSEVNINEMASGPEGIAYIPSGSAGFTNLSMVVSSYGQGTVVVYEVGAEGLPKVETGRLMVTGLSGAEGAWIDPVTGDFLFSTFGGGDKVVRISGFEKPSAVGDNQLTGDYGLKVLQDPGSPGITVVLGKDIDASGTIISIKNTNGQELSQQQASGQSTTIDVSALASGMYVVRITEGTIVRTAKFIRR